MIFPNSYNYVILLVRWAYVPTKRAVTRNVPSEARRILVGPEATGPKRYPWVIEDVTDFLETCDFALIKPKEYKRGQGRVGSAEGAICIYKIKRKLTTEALDNIVKFCEEWKREGKFGVKILSYEIILSRTVAFK